MASSVNHKIAVLLLILGSTSVSHSQTATEFVASFDLPLFITSPPGDNGRLFVAEKGSSGTANIRIYDLTNKKIVDTPYLTIDGLSTSGERGLLGLAFDPNFATNGHFYTYVSVPGGSQDHRSEIRRYTANGNPLDSHSANSNSLFNVLSFDQPFSNHNAGWIGFNPKRTPADPQYLYIASGDGGPGNDPNNLAQNINSLLGKILRLDVRHSQVTAPPSNPFVNLSGEDEIWAYGLRNPYRNSFDRETGDLWIADVGQSSREEINLQKAASNGGENYGWRIMEGNQCFDNSQSGSNPACHDASLTPPVYQYGRDSGEFGGRSVTGGYVYRGSVPAFQGLYFFADFSEDNIWTLDPHAVDIPASVIHRNSDLVPDSGALQYVASFGEDATGELYVANLFGGQVWRIVTSSKNIHWNGNDTSAGVAGDGIHWNDPNNWTRGVTSDIGFVADDQVIFDSGSNHLTIDLQGTQTVSAAKFNTDYWLTNGQLRVLSGNITVQPGVTATFTADLSSETNHSSLRKLGEGTLLINSTAGQLVVQSGTLGGSGNVAHLTVHSGVVAPGHAIVGTAIPEPSTILLSCIAFLLIFGRIPGNYHRHPSQIAS